MQPHHFKLTYQIPSTTVKSAAPAKKAFTLRWVRKASASEYQIRYTPKSTYADYNWRKAKTVTVSGKESAAKTAKLKRNTKYVAQLRVVRSIEGERCCSSWSGKKSVTTK